MSMYIRITIHEARDLIAADLNGFSDPYVVIAGSTMNSKTSVKDKNLNPVWNESFELEFPTDRRPAITLTVWDKDLITDDFLGMVHIELSDLPLDGTGIWRDLAPRPGKKDKIKGQLKVSFVPGTKPSDAAKAAQAAASSQVAGRLKAANEQDATELDLTGCNLADVPEGVLAVPEWTSLDLGFNLFDKFPDPVCNFKFLAELFLSGNRITSLTPAIAGLSGSLRSLYLNGNYLTALSADVAFLTNLEKLDIANNQIKVLPPEIGALHSLEELRANGNPLQGLPTELGSLQYLITLDLNGCDLQAISEKVFTLPRLLELDLGTNQLTQLPADFGNLTRLVTLNLADNKLTDLPLSMGKCESMDSCQLERNPINNEALMTKYNMGTDHLIDYLSKRLFEQEQLAKRRMKQGIDAKNKRPPLSNGPESSSPGASPSAPRKGPGGRPRLTDVMASAEEPTEGDPGELNWVIPGQRVKRFDDSDSEEDEPELTAEQKEQIAWSKLSPEERTMKKRYAAQAVCHHIRQQLVHIKKGVMTAKTVEECLPWAKATRDLKNEADAIVDLLGRYEKPQPAPLFPHETKFQQLKKTTQVALKEVEAVNNAVLNTCSTLIQEDRVDAFREFLKRAQARLDQEVGDPRGPFTVKP